MHGSWCNKHCPGRQKQAVPVVVVMPAQQARHARGHWAVLPELSSSVSQVLVHTHDLHLLTRHLWCLLHGSSASSVQLEGHIRQCELPHLQDSSVPGIHCGYMVRQP